MSDPKKSDNKTVQEQPKAEAKAVDPVSLATDIAQKFIEGLMPAVIKAAQPQPQAAPAQRYTSRRARRRCDVCGWHLASNDLKECDKHEEVIAYPVKHPEYATWFEGIKINGVRFRSPDESTPVKVPFGMAGTVLKMVQDYERAEYEARNGKQKIRKSGSISGNGGSRLNPTPADSPAGWH